MLLMHFSLAASLVMTTCAVQHQDYSLSLSMPRRSCSAGFFCAPSHLQPRSNSAVLAHDLTWWFDQLENGDACPGMGGWALPPGHLQKNNVCLVIIKIKLKKYKKLKLQTVKIT